MRGALRGGLAALALGVAVGAAMAEPQGGWLPSWLGGKPAVKPMDKPDDKPDKHEVRKRELGTSINAYLRRQAVCIKLKQIAEEAGNTALAEEADRLDKLAWELHQQRSGQVMGASGAGLEEPKIDRGLDDTRDLLIESAKKRKGNPGPDSGSSASMGRGGVGR